MKAKKRVTRKADKVTVEDRKFVAELNVERVALQELKPHPKNPRVHPEEGSEEWNVLLSSLSHDYFDPIVWNRRNGMLVSGHLRRKVMEKMGVTEADVVVVDYDENVHVARMIAANKLMGVNDNNVLSELFSSLKNDDFDLALTGFTLPEVEGLPHVEEETMGTDAAESDTERYTTDDVTLIEKWFGKGAVPTLNAENGSIWRVGDNYMYVGSVLNDHTVYVPLLTRLSDEFPERQVLLVPMPDPLMVGHVDTKVACVFIQPSPVAAALALTLTKKIRSKHRIERVNESKSAKAKAK